MSPARFDDAIVLVVDDHEDSREALALILESLGVTVMRACDGYEALNRIGERVPALILCDLKMPGMDGFAFMRAVRGVPAVVHARIIALTGLTSGEDVRRVWAAGFDGHLAKPIDYDAVVDAVEHALSRRAAERRD